ncbi:MAG: glycosyltransferase [Clostridia bacterium]|nr:glycosyltransferase [Clostridia bacterium]
MSKKKILIVSGGMEIGGIERSLLGLLGEFDYDSYDVDLFLYSVSGEFLPLVDKRCNLLPEIPQCAAMTKPLKTVLGKYPLIALSRLYKRFTVQKKYGLNDASSFALLSGYWQSCVKYMPSPEKEYDAAVSFMWPHEYTAKKVKAKKKIAWIHTDYTVARMDFEKDEKTWAVFDKIAGVSDDVCAAFAKVYPSLADKLVTVENILSPDFVRAQAQLERPGETDGTLPSVLSVGRFCSAKAFELIPQYSRIMLDKGFGHRWYIIGYGGEEKLIKDEIEKYNVSENVIVLGKKANPYPYMAACDIYAQPSRYEGKAVTVREAQILGKPVLITDFETAKSQVENGVDGIICPMGAQSVADAVIQLIDSKETREKLSLNCLERNYGNKDSLQTIYKLIES